MRIKFISTAMLVGLATSMLVGCTNNASQIPAEIPTEISTETPIETPNETPNDYEEGISETDNIVNTKASDKVILVVSFGTSYNQPRHLAIGGIESAIATAYPDYQIRRAFTSQIIIDKLAARENLVIDNVTEAMERLVLDKVKEVIIQPTTVLNGFEYDDMIAEVMPFVGKFDSFKIGRHLLSDDIDFDEVSQILIGETTEFRSDDTAIVYMGHGTEHESASIYTRLQNILIEKGYSDYIIGAVEHGVEIDQVQEILSQKDISKVILLPLMIVSGDHANNDMASDEEDSWKTILENDGYAVETILKGLGEIKGIQELFVRHVKEAMQEESIAKIEEPDKSAKAVAPKQLQDGTYSVEVSTDASMFRVVDCQLTVENGIMTAVMTLSGQGYSALYMGKAEDAESDESNQIAFALQDEKHSFTVPVAALDTDIDCAALGTKSGTWYDHTIVFKSPNEPGLINVTLSGGTGRAGIESPAEFFTRDGVDMAKIVWSSSNYTYMIVDEVEYLPINTEGNSTFEIPIELDTDMEISACTVAMGSPRVIEYVLRFDSESIK